MSEILDLPEKELVLPPGVKLPKIDHEYENAEQKAQSIPDPKGWRILCALVEAGDTFESGILKSDETLRYDELLTTVLFVVDLGPDCYKDPTRFPNGAWCKKGDFILVRPNAGTRLVIHDREFRIINDDSVEAIVDDPRGIKRK
jgi:co-chaperonin GroES (HSP10)